MTYYYSIVTLSVTSNTLPLFPARILFYHKVTPSPRYRHGQQKHLVSTSINLQKNHFTFAMLDVNDFVADRGGDLNKIRESQRRRFAPESVV
jgi:hypothetical protein